LQREGEGLAPDCIGLGALLGRDGELARFDQAAARARSGSGSQLALCGPPGSGKSRLLGRFGVAAELTGMRVLRVGAGRGLETLCRWLGLLLGDRSPAEPTVAVAQKWLAAACERHPLALLLDDADADPGLFALVTALARSRAWKRRPLLVAAVAAGPIEG